LSILTGYKLNILIVCIYLPNFRSFFRCVNVLFEWQHEFDSKHPRRRPDFLVNQYGSCNTRRNLFRMKDYGFESASFKTFFIRISCWASYVCKKFFTGKRIIIRKTKISNMDWVAILKILLRQSSCNRLSYVMWISVRTWYFSKWSFQ
jgi:hypothetical protein